MTLARDLVRALAQSAGRPLPPVVAEAARLHLLDAIGVGLAAAGTAAGQPYRGYTRQAAQGGKAGVFGQSAGAEPEKAALINGGLIHSLEYDDTHTASIVHGSAVLAPSALAASQAVDATGADLLSAYAHGWEFLIRIGLAAPGGFQATGFQVTSAGGAMAAAHIAAELWGLDENARVAAIGIALSQASGVFEFLSNGATVKSMHPGWAAHAGLMAAALAQSGVTGPETAFEGRFGLFSVFARDGEAPARLSGMIGDIGSRWHLTDAAFKFTPCCHYLHPFVEAAGKLADSGVRAEDCESILCRAPRGAAGIVCEPWADKIAPKTGHAVRWSLPGVVAARLVEERVDLDTFEKPLSHDVLAVAERVTWEPLVDDGFPQRFQAEIVCRLRDGSVREVYIDDVYGNRSRPAAPEAVREKFRANAARTLTPEGCAALEAAVDALDGCGGLQALGVALGMARPQQGDMS